jgi:hypothetical protein
VAAFAAAPLAQSSAGARGSLALEDVATGMTVLTPSGGNDAPIIAAASGRGPIVLGRGQFIVSGNLTCEGQVSMRADAQLAAAGSATIAFNGGFDAPLAHVFGAGVTVTFNASFLSEGHPEWWGAISNKPSVDCSSAINACIVACPTTLLGWADYHVTNPVILNLSGRRFSGVASFQSAQGGNWSPDGRGSRIVVDSHTCDGLQIGPVTQPSGGMPTFPQHMFAEHFTVIRSVRVTPAASGLDGPAGVRLRFCTSVTLDDIQCLEHTVGFHYAGTVHCYTRYCQAIRNMAGTTSINDFFVAFFQENRPKIGANSGNASLYFDHNSGFTSGVSLMLSAAHYSAGGFTDTFINATECGNMDFGLNMNGAGRNDANFSAEDLLITNCVLDSVKNTGILINAANNGCAVTASGCYIAGGTGIAATNCGGSVSLTGNQLLGCKVGIYGYFSNGVSTSGNILTQCVQPIILTACTNGKLQDTVNCNVTRASVAAVRLQGCARIQWDGIINGSAGFVPIGVSLEVNASGPAAGIPCDYNEIRCSGIDSQCLAGPSGANKLVYRGAQITATGVIAGTHNLVDGIMT